MIGCIYSQVAASELKADRKIDIVMRTMTPAVSRIARYEPSPAESSYADCDESRDDLSMEKSFESAIDESLVRRISEDINWKMILMNCLSCSL